MLYLAFYSNFLHSLFTNSAVSLAPMIATKLRLHGQAKKCRLLTRGLVLSGFVVVVVVVIVVFVMSLEEANETN